MVKSMRPSIDGARTSRSRRNVCSPRSSTNTGVRPTGELHLLICHVSLERRFISTISPSKLSPGFLGHLHRRRGVILALRRHQPMVVNCITSESGHLRRVTYLPWRTPARACSRHRAPPAPDVSSAFRADNRHPPAGTTHARKPACRPRRRRRGDGGIPHESRDSNRA